MDEATVKAFEMLENLPAEPQVLDIGCGPGMQSIALAKAMKGGKLFALDIHEPFLDNLRDKVTANGLNETVTAVKGSMTELPFESEVFDLIWSEGAIYVMGVEEALKAWKPFIKKGGYLVFSEISWLHNNPAAEVASFWMGEYPAMTTISGNIKRIEEAGYAPIGHFILPNIGWWDDYYEPLLSRVAMLREKYPDDLEENLVLDLTVKEIEMYRRFSNDYGYVFYLMEKR